MRTLISKLVHCSQRLFVFVIFQGECIECVHLCILKALCMCVAAYMCCFLALKPHDDGKMS